MEQKIKFPRSEKVYISGKLFPDIRVAMRKVEQVPSTTFNGDEKIITPNPKIYVYDTSGPFSDPEISVDLKKGLPRMREEWILKRGDVEQLPEITSVCVVMIKVWIISVSNISPCHTGLRKESTSPKWHMPNGELSLRKWNM